jgi:hypothetical protein
MPSTIVSLSDEDVIALKRIVLDEDGTEALLFLKRRLLSQIERRERSKLDVDGKQSLS